MSKIGQNRLILDLLPHYIDGLWHVEIAAQAPMGNLKAAKIMEPVVRMDVIN